MGLVIRVESAPSPELATQMADAHPARTPRARLLTRPTTLCTLIRRPLEPATLPNPAVCLRMSCAHLSLVNRHLIFCMPWTGFLRNMIWLFVIGYWLTRLMRYLEFASSGSFSLRVKLNKKIHLEGLHTFFSTRYVDLIDADTEPSSAYKEVEWEVMLFAFRPRTGAPCLRACVRLRVDACPELQGMWGAARRRRPWLIGEVGENTGR